MASFLLLVRYNIYSMKRLFLYIFFASSLLLPSFAFAQIGNAGLEDLSIEIYPKTPGSHTPTTITISSYSDYVDTASISWYLDNKLILSGVGKKNFVFTTGEIGSTSLIRLVIAPERGISTTKELRISPTGMDILWQATDSVVPPMYRGKALPASEAKIRFVAIPEIKKTDGTLAGQYDLLYRFNHNNEGVSANSGYGNNSIDIDANYLNKNERVEVTATTRDGSITATNTATVRTGNPFVVWYPMSPLYGPLFDRSISGEYKVTNSAVSVVALPYFFSPKNPSSNRLEYSWELNGNKIDTPSLPNTLFLQRNNSETGRAIVNVIISNVDSLFQEASSSLNLLLK